MKTLSLNFSKDSGLLPAIVQDVNTNQVLMLGFMNEEAYQKTLKTSTVWFWSRAKQRLWQKGEESGNTLTVIDVIPDCDQDTILIKAIPEGPTCHTGAVSCFEGDRPQDALEDLFAVILDRQKTMPPDSYTASLFRAGLNKICAKVKEESDEVIQAARKETKQRVIEETADVIYHLFVLIANQGVALKEIMAELDKRKK